MPEPQCLHARQCCVASRADVTDFRGIMREDCLLWWCPDCGALHVNNGPWLEPSSSVVERKVLELQRRRREVGNAH